MREGLMMLTTILLSSAFAGPLTITAGDTKVKAGTVQAWALTNDEVKLSFFEAKAEPCDPTHSSFSYNSVVFAPRGKGEGRFWVVDSVFSAGGDLLGAEMGHYPDLRPLTTKGVDEFVLKWEEVEAAGDEGVTMNFGGTFKVMACGPDKHLIKEKAEVEPTP